MVSLESFAERMASKATDLPAFRGFSLIEVKEVVAEALDTLGKVNGIFATYTNHDISHIDNMLEMLDWLIPPTTRENMTTADWLMIVLAIYFHDLGMVVTSEEYDKRSENQLFQEFLTKIKTDSENSDYIARTSKMTYEEQNKFFYQEFIRSQHAIRIREWITGNVSKYWGENIKSIIYEIEKTLDKLPIRFKKNLADICESHHKDNLDDISIYPLCQRYGNKPQELANIQYSALILRTADLLHVTQNRAPSIMYKIVRFSDPKGVDSWKKHRGTFSVYMKSREFNENDPDSHVIIISADFKEEKPFFSLTEYVSYANDQIIQSKRWADNSRKELDGKSYSFPWQTVIGDIRVEGNIPYQMNFELDRGRLLDLLVGHTIYNEPTVAIRELLQNAIDAVRYEYYLVKKRITLPNTIQPEIGRVIIKWDPDKRELIVEDNGTGMDLDVIKYHLMRVGSSFYNTAKFQTENFDYTPISRFGIGILTCFMISDDIEIITCKKNCGYRIKMSSVQGSYLLKKLELGTEILDGLEPHGTRVKLQIRESIDFLERDILEIIRYWIILPDCKIIYKEKGEEEVIVGFDNPSEALKHFMSDEYTSNIEIISAPIENNGSNYELTFAVEHSAFMPERNFVLADYESELPIVCIEGIRVNNEMPGFGDTFASIISIKGNKTLRTTVSRTTLEKDNEYIKIGMICAELFSKYIKNEVVKISSSKGEPLSQASTASIRLQRAISNRITDEEVLEYFHELYAKIPTIVIENTKKDEVTVTSRNLISENELEKVGVFWAIESRLVDYLGIISRDLGRELSLNDFLGKLAPELLDNRISPILPDAHLFKKIILSSYQLSQVDFSQKNQQTLMKWGLKEVVSNCNCYSIHFFDKTMKSYIHALLRDRSLRDRSKYDYREIFDIIQTPLLIAPIVGDIKKVRGIKTRIAVILNPESKLVSAFQVLEKATKKIKNNDVMNIYLLTDFLSQMITIASTDMIKEFDSSYNCNNYSYTSTSERYLEEDKAVSEILWRKNIVEINRLLNKVGINEKIDITLDEIFNEGNIFDASMYWLNWNDL
jgi:molecular chaperone HtpG